MGLKALLTVDLKDGVEEKQRTHFNSVLQQRGWKKIDDLTTVWRREFGDQDNIAVVNATAQRDVGDAARGAKIETYRAAVQAGAPTVLVFGST